MDNYHLLNNVRTPSTDALASVTSVIDDLELVVNYTLELKKALIVIPHNNVIIAGLYTSALVTYCRCFGKGKREPLKVDVFDDLPTEAMDAHNYFKDMRDKHIAHSVNKCEHVQVGVMLVPEELGPKGILGHGFVKVRRMTDSIDGVQVLYQLAQHACVKMKRLQRELLDKVEEECHDLDLDELYRGATFSYVAPSSEDAGKPR